MRDIDEQDIDEQENIYQAVYKAVLFIFIKLNKYSKNNSHLVRL